MLSPARSLGCNFLHVCGGVSLALPPLDTPVVFSPRMWRCFPIQRSRLDTRLFSPRMWRCFLKTFSGEYFDLIFSTYVEVFLGDIEELQAQIYFLHVCGGVSD